MANFTAAGWGQAAANGTLKPNGETNNSTPVWTINGQNTSPGAILYNNGTPQLEYNHTSNGLVAGADIAWWFNDIGNLDPTAGNWTNNGGGTVGTIVLAPNVNVNLGLLRTG